MRLTIADHYLGFTPTTSHLKDCKFAGTDMWEVARLHRTRRRAAEYGGDYTETIVRLLCRTCGVVHMDHGESWGTQTTTTEQIGYGAKPQRCAGLWLHPGPVRYNHADSHEPELLYVTGSQTPPADHTDVIGIIGWERPFNGSRYGAVRWWAGLGVTEDGRARTLAPEDLTLKSRTAATRWVAEQHAAHLAAAQAAAEVAEAVRS